MRACISVMAFLLRIASSDISVFLEIAFCMPPATEIVSSSEYIERFALPEVAREDGVAGLPPLLSWL